MANDIGKPDFLYHLQHFLQSQLPADLDASSSLVFCIPDKISVFSTAVATFYAPSNLCRTGGMHHKCIHAVTSWRHGKPQHDCVFTNTDKLKPGMHGLSVVPVRLFFSVTMKCVKYPCALVHWYSLVRDSPNENTGIWVIEQDILDNGKPWTAVIYLDSILHLAHLLPIYGDKQAPRDMKYMDSLDIFEEFYINQFADNHAFEIAF